jgi:hypothetical protein
MARVPRVDRAADVPGTIANPGSGVHDVELVDPPR